MKAIFFALLLSVSQLSFAQILPHYFNGSTQVQILPLRVSVEVFNPYYEPIICSGQVFGHTFYGPTYNAFFLEQLIPVGHYRYAFVQTNNSNPFVNGWANIQCRFLRW